MGAKGIESSPPPANPLTIRVSADKMQVLLSHNPPLPDLKQLLQSVEIALAALPFSQPDLRERWEPRVTQAALMHAIHDLVLVEGTPPIPPSHGRIEWVADFFSKGFMVDAATGRANYRQRAAQKSVEKDQLLARIIAPVEGVDGTDVFGRKVAVEKAKPAKLRAGQNVSIDEAAGTVHAAATGRIRLKDGVVTVDEVFTIEGSVGLQTGNIRHPGALIVHGDIEAGAIVETAGNIEVTGIVEAAAITTQGDLIVHGGITGGDGQRIRAANVRAKFLLDAGIESTGDVVVESEIVQSCIVARGVVSCSRGRIVGGRIAAQNGIEATQVGSDAGVRTVLTAGHDLELEAKLAACDEKLAEWQRQCDRIVDRIAPLKAHPERLDAPARRAMEQLDAQVHQIEAEMSAVQNEKRRLREESKTLCRPQLVVLGRAYPECFVALADEHIRFTEPMQGPVCFENVDGVIRTRIIQGSQRSSQLLDAS